MRCHLIHPLRDARVRVAGEQGHAPTVVAGAHDGIPRARIAAAVVDEIERGVVSEPAPSRAAAELPLLALPGAQARVRADRLAEIRRATRIDQELRVRADAIGLPDFPTGSDVVRDDEATYAVLAAADARDHLVFDDQRRVGIRLAIRGVAIDRRPHHRAGLCIERDELGIGLLQEDLAVTVSEPAVHGVAAHHGNRVGVLSGGVSPVDRLIGQVDREDFVRKRRVDVERVADDEWTAFMTAQHTGGECPRDLQATDVGLVDLRQLAVSRPGIVAAPDGPVARIGDQFFDIFIGAGETRNQQSERHDKALRVHPALLMIRLRSDSGWAAAPPSI